MPNDCTNNLNASGNGKTIESFYKKYITQNKNEEPFLDFDKVIPMPKELDVSKNSSAEHVYDLLYGLVQYKNNPAQVENMVNMFFLKKEVEESGKTPEELIEEILKHSPTAKEEAEQYHSNFQKYGAKTWYDWRLENWGTKWNSYDCFAETDEDHIYMQFSTAWSPCTPVVKKLIEDNPELAFSFSYDEPGMGFRGEIEGSNGQVTKDHYEEYEYEDEEEDDEEDE
ncbi:hypothetical protein [Burkholderia contaminans]|uniref:DUF1281 family ferredoxin-like fold protein n=1 Tax=Burkholderia contaminans TaxID=488447 RepID=UPI00158DFF93|nr:hypothetical protein [Burkholderia contaminans]